MSLRKLIKTKFKALNLQLNQQKQQIQKVILAAHKMPLTSQQLEELARYKSANHSTNAQSEESNLSSIQSMATDLMKIIKTEENVFSHQFKKAFNRQKQKPNMSEKLQRHYCTERNSRQKDSQIDQKNNKFNCLTVKDWMSAVDYGNQAYKQQQKDSFFLDEHIETSEYIPVRYEQYQNPQKMQLNQKNYHQSSFIPIDHKNQGPKQRGNQTQNKVKALPIKSAQTLTKQVKKPLKTPPSTPKLQHKLSESLISPVKNFKKHILHTVDQKRQLEQNQLARLVNKPKIELSQFYQSNQTHIPLYEKSKILHAKKLQTIEAYTIQQFGTELNQSTFMPVVNSRTQKLVDGKTFEQRLEQYEAKKEQNQQKIIYQVLENFPFKPKLNTNLSVESRIKKIWEEKTTLIKEEPQDQSENVEGKRQKNMDFFALRLQERQVEQLFAD